MISKGDPMPFYQHRPFWLVLMAAMAVALIVYGVTRG